VIELNGELIAEYLDQREMYAGANIMIRRRGDRDKAEEPTTYLGLAVTAPVERGHERPVVTSGDGVAFRWPAPEWSREVVGQEPPLGFSIDEVGAALGGAGHEPLHSTDTAVAKSPVQGRAGERSSGER
jgi:hypothetical protein